MVWRGKTVLKRLLYGNGGFPPGAGYRTINALVSLGLSEVLEGGGRIGIGIGIGYQYSTPLVLVLDAQRTLILYRACGVAFRKKARGERQRPGCGNGACLASGVLYISHRHSRSNRERRGI
jgi:hypothetical protein